MTKAHRHQHSPALIGSVVALSLSLVLTLTPCCDVFASSAGSGASELATSPPDHSHDPAGDGDPHAPDPLCQPNWIDTASDVQRDIGPAGNGTMLLLPTLFDRQISSFLSIPSTADARATPRSIGPPLYLRFGRLLN